jgi:hypothetical protein
VTHDPDLVGEVIEPLPVKEPSPELFQLLDEVTTAAQSISGVTGVGKIDIVTPMKEQLQEAAKRVGDAIDRKIFEWVEDWEAADKYAQTHARKLSEPPHHVRCNFMKDGVRCVRGAGHPSSIPHTEPKV